MKFSALTDRVKGDSADVWDLNYLAKAEKAKGKDVIVLSVGDPNFDTPKPIADKALEAIQQGDTHYTSICGHDGLREAIAKRHREISGQPVEASHVITTSGAQNALFACSLCLLDPGDEAIVLQPMYVTYEATIQAPGAKLVPVVLSAENGFRLQREQLEAAITEKTRAIFYASPSNPTGIALQPEELAMIAELAIEHDFWIIADEVYGDFVFDEQFHPMASVEGISDRLVTIGSMSKSYAMSGWRVGWAIAPHEMVENMDKLALCMLYGLPGFIQQAAEFALGNCQADLISMREAYQKRRDKLFDMFSQVDGLQPVMPNAGMFMMVNVSACVLSTSDFCWALYRATGVSVLDATAFGASAEGHVRISFTVDDAELEEAARRIIHFVESLR